MPYPEPPNGTEHPEDLLLPYVEGLLQPEEENRVTQHVLVCSRCSSDVERLRATISILRDNREAFCPSSWQLYEFLHYGHDPHDAVADHLRSCPSCSHLVETLSAHAPAEEMPSALWEQVRSRFPHSDETSSPLHRRRVGLLERFSRLFRVPALAAGAAIAALLLVVVLYPREMPQSVVALSSVTWEGIPKPKPFDQSRKRVAILLAFKGFDPPMTQQKIDSWYESLAPPMEMYERFSVVSPAEVREAVSKGWVTARDRQDLLERLRGSLGVSQVILVRAEAALHGTNLVTELLHTASGTVIAQKTVTGVSDAELEQTIKQTAFRELLGLPMGSGKE